MSLDDFKRIPLVFGASPVHRLERLSEHLGGKVDIWSASLAGRARSPSKRRRSTSSSTHAYAGAF